MAEPECEDGSSSEVDMNPRDAEETDEETVEETNAPTTSRRRRQVGTPPGSDEEDDVDNTVTQGQDGEDDGDDGDDAEVLQAVDVDDYDEDAVPEEEEEEVRMDPRAGDAMLDQEPEEQFVPAGRQQRPRGRRTAQDPQRGQGGQTPQGRRGRGRRGGQRQRNQAPDYFQHDTRGSEDFFEQEYAEQMDEEPDWQHDRFLAYDDELTTRTPRQLRPRGRRGRRQPVWVPKGTKPEDMPKATQTQGQAQGQVQGEENADVEQITRGVEQMGPSPGGGRRRRGRRRNEPRGEFQGDARGDRRQAPRTGGRGEPLDNDERRPRRGGRRRRGRQQAVADEEQDFTEERSEEQRRGPRGGQGRGRADILRDDEPLPARRRRGGGGRGRRRRGGGGAGGRGRGREEPRWIEDEPMEETRGRRQPPRQRGRRQFDESGPRGRGRGVPLDREDPRSIRRDPRGPGGGGLVDPTDRGFGPPGRTGGPGGRGPRSRGGGGGGGGAPGGGGGGVVGDDGRPEIRTFDPSKDSGRAGRRTRNAERGGGRGPQQQGAQRVERRPYRGPVTARDNDPALQYSPQDARHGRRGRMGPGRFDDPSMDRPLARGRDIGLSTGRMGEAEPQVPPRHRQMGGGKPFRLDDRREARQFETSREVGPRRAFEEMANRSRAQEQEKPQKPPWNPSDRISGPPPGGSRTTHGAMVLPGPQAQPAQQGGSAFSRQRRGVESQYPQDAARPYGLQGRAPGYGINAPPYYPSQNFQTDRSQQAAQVRSMAQPGRAAAMPLSGMPYGAAQRPQQAQAQAAFQNPYFQGAPHMMDRSGQAPGMPRGVAANAAASRSQQQPSQKQFNLPELKRPVTQKKEEMRFAQQW